MQTSTKHYILKQQKTQRTRTPLEDGRVIDGTSSNADDRTIHELYLWPFLDAIKAGTTSIMCSYNRVNGTYACEDEQLLTGILRDELGFRGFVVSDWFASHWTAETAKAGLDMEQPGDLPHGYENFGGSGLGRGPRRWRSGMSPRTGWTRWLAASWCRISCWGKMRGIPRLMGTFLLRLVRLIVGGVRTCSAGLSLDGRASGATTTSLFGRWAHLISNKALAANNFAAIYPVPDVCLVFLKTWAEESKDRVSFENDWNSTLAVENTAAFCGNRTVVDEFGGGEYHALDGE